MADDRGEQTEEDALLLLAAIKCAAESHTLRKALGAKLRLLMALDTTHARND
jgi:hypothetical protein